MAKGRLGLLAVRPAPDQREQALLSAASHLGVRVVADLDCLLLSPDDHRLHLLQLAIALGCTMETVARSGLAERADRLLLGPKDAAALFADLPNALAATADIADQCRFDFRSITVRPADFDPDAAATGALAARCRLHIPGFARRRPWTSRHEQRLVEELAVFRAMGFAGYMRIVGDILEHCRENRITAAVRGSAVGSLALNLLASSGVDPLEHGLLFERFLHKGKTAWPDVDVDLPWHRRDAVLAWALQYFGADRTAMVSTLQTFRHRAALGEGLKALGIPAPEIGRLAAGLPPEELAHEDMDFLDLAASGNGGPGSATTAGSKRLRPALDLVQRLVGRPRHISVHPAGLVIAPCPLQELLPLELAPKGVTVTQYDLVGIARPGLAKIDLLGNRCLSELEEVYSGHGGFAPAAIPLDDPAALALIDRADTIGCFQLESPAMRSLLARLPVRGISDVTAALALIRPGIAAGRIKSAFVARSRGSEPATMPFPAMADRLRENHGLFLYEEDIMLLLARMGGIGLGEADEIRAAIVKHGDDRALMARLEARFTRSALAHGSSSDEIRRAWGTAVRLAPYSFNKAHAVSYGLLGYAAAFAKAHEPTVYACSLLNHHQGLYPLRTVAADLMRHGVVFLPPDVQRSAPASTVEMDGPPAVRIGLGRIRGLSRAAIARIMAAREAAPFADMADLLSRTRLKGAEIRVLVLSGACDGLYPLSEGVYPFMHELLLERLGQGEAMKRFEPEGGPRAAADDAATLLYSRLVRVRNELRLLGLHVTAHPLALLREEIRRYGCMTIAEATAAGKQVVRLAVLVAAMRRVATGSGVMQFLTLEDETGLLESVVPAQGYRRLGERVTTPGPFLADGRLRRLQGAMYLEVTGLSPLHRRRMPYRGGDHGTTT